MFGENRLKTRGLVLLALFCLAAACSFNRASSKLAPIDVQVRPEFPKRVGVASIIGNLAAGQDATDRFSRGLTDLGFEVLTNNWDIDRRLGGWGRGIDEAIPESTRVRLAERYGMEGLFVGILSQDKGNLINDTRLSIRLISIPEGRTVWSADVVGEGAANLSHGVKVRAVAAAEKALHALQKDMSVDPPTNPGRQKSSVPMTRAGKSQ